MNKSDPVEKWLEPCGENTRNCYLSNFRAFEQYIGKSGAQMLAEHRELRREPETSDVYPEKVFQFYRYLLSGAVKIKRMGSVKGRAGGWTGKYKDKSPAQTTARTAATAIQSFFNFHNMPISLRKFIRKDARMRNPKPEKKKHQLLAPEINALIKVAQLRDRAVLSLGLMGQDESTVSVLKIEKFEGILDGKTLEFVELLRPKTNEDILLLLTPEVQEILSTYIKSLGKSEGWLFSGYKSNHIEPSLCNDIFKDLCKRAGVRAKTGRRLSYHCCRMWFSTQLRNRVSDDIIDLLTGHVQRFNGAYMGDTEKIRELLIEAEVTEVLRLESARRPIEEDQFRKKALLDFARLQGYEDDKLKRLQEVLARSGVDEGIKEFRRFGETEESETGTDGNGKYYVANGETELMEKLNNHSWKLVQSLNDDKYLLQHS
jgi:integrase